MLNMGHIPIIRRIIRIERESAASERYKNEITNEMAIINVKREIVLSAALIIMVAAILAISLLSLDTQEESLYVSLASNRLHILLLLGSLAFLIIVYGHKGNFEKDVSFLRIAHIFIVNFVMVLCSIIAINNELAGQRPFSYLTAMLCIGAIILMPTFERMTVYIISWFIYQTGIIFWVGDPKTILQNFVFVTMLMVLSMLISKMNYSEYISNFINRKTIEENSIELDQLYKSAEENLLKRTEELNKAIELEKVRSAFFSNISHELRTPLNLIFSAEQMLECTIKSIRLEANNKEIDQYMRIMKQNCYRLIRLISNLIDITKIDAGHLQFNSKSCDIIKIVEDITLSAANYIEERNISLIFDTEVEERVISCDPDKIERIILNLLSNAIKFTPEGGQIFVNIYDRWDKIVLSVKDTGIGISEAMTEQIFERFVQVDKTFTRVREGSGIGLSLVKALVEMHDGIISVKSELGKGSVFIVELPAIQSGYESSCEECGYMNRNQRIENINIEFSDIYD
jgi:signal transduction histidine kinase